MSEARKFFEKSARPPFCESPWKVQSHLVHLFPNKGGAPNFKGLSQGGRRTDFSENLRASLFNDDLSNEPNLSPIHLAG